MPRTHHAASHSLVKMLGSISFHDAISLPLERFGRTILSQKKPQASEVASIARAIEAHESKIARLKASGRTKTVAEWMARAQVLRLMRKVRFKPHANHVAAALALAHGLEQEKLLPQINSFLIANKRSGGALFSGSLSQLHSSIKRNLPYLVHSVLHSSPRALSSGEIATKIGLKGSRREKGMITHALGVLDLAGLTYKLPAQESLRYKWVHACHQNSRATIPKWNLDWLALESLKKKSRKISDLSKPFEIPGGFKGGFESGLATDLNIKLSFLRLKKAGMVRLQSIKTGVGMQASLSKKGRKLLEAQASLVYLHPELRVALLTLPSQKGEIDERNRLLVQRLSKWALVHSSLVAEKRHSRADSLLQCVNTVHKATGVGHSTVYGIASRQVPWKNVSIERLEKVVLELGKKEPAKAKYLSRHLKKISRTKQ